MSRHCGVKYLKFARGKVSLHVAIIGHTEKELRGEFPLQSAWQSRAVRTVYNNKHLQNGECMWIRAELKRNAKQTLSRNYWKCVLVSLILAVATGALQIGSVSTAASWVSEGIMASMQNYASEGTYFTSILTAALVLIGLIAAALRMVGTLIRIFLFAPLEIGGRSFYVLNREENASLKNLTKGFTVNYLNVVKTMFLRDLFTGLWSLLFIIPGIIKSYEYRMIPYILAENPQIDSKEAFRLSKEMMMGEKWKAFVLDLSFLGWEILSCFTFGILSIFFVSPYVDNTNAELYAALKNKTFGGGQGGTAWEDAQESWENADAAAYGADDFADVQDEAPVYSETIRESVYDDGVVGAGDEQ